jgi:hypothetical protein
MAAAVGDDPTTSSRRRGSARGGTGTGSGSADAIWLDEGMLYCMPHLTHFRDRPASRDSARYFCPQRVQVNLTIVSIMQRPSTSLTRRQLSMQCRPPRANCAEHYSGSESCLSRVNRFSDLMEIARSGFWAPKRRNEGAGARTQDLRIKSPLLYLLSYTLVRRPRTAGDVIYPRRGLHARTKRAC